MLEIRGRKIWFLTQRNQTMDEKISAEIVHENWISANKACKRVNKSQCVKIKTQ